MTNSNTLSILREKIDAALVALYHAGWSFHRASLVPPNRIGPKEEENCTEIARQALAKALTASLPEEKDKAGEDAVWYSAEGYNQALSEVKKLLEELL